MKWLEIVNNNGENDETHPTPPHFYWGISIMIALDDNNDENEDICLVAVQESATLLPDFTETTQRLALTSVSVKSSKGDSKGFSQAPDLLVVNRKYWTPFFCNAVFWIRSEYSEYCLRLGTRVNCDQLAKEDEAWSTRLEWSQKSLHLSHQSLNEWLQWIISISQFVPLVHLIFFQSLQTDKRKK